MRRFNPLLAALALVSTPVWASSTVTLYGVVDVGIGKTEGGKVKMTSSETLTNGNSRWGLRGLEDLGGGNKAGFNLEATIVAKTGGVAADGFWSRMAVVWVEGPWGQVKMGRTLNPSFYGTGAWELTGFANYSAVGSTYQYAGSGPRNNSQFTYKTPSFGGLSSEIGYVFKADNKDLAKVDMNVIYRGGPFNVGFSANKTDTKGLNYALGARYNLGQNWSFSAAYNDLKNHPTSVRRQGVYLGAMFTQNVYSVTLELTHDTKNGALKKHDNFLLEGRYSLSKRSFVYTAVFRKDGVRNATLGVRHNF